MTTPAEERIGFDVRGRFYPYIPLDDWFNQDFVLARTLTRVGIDDLVSGKADYLAVQQALLAVAVWHANPDQTMDRIISHVNTIKPSEIDEVGFESDLDTEADAGPPDAGEGDSAPHSSSSGTGEPSSESTSEPSPPGSSGRRRSTTGSPA